MDCRMQNVWCKSISIRPQQGSGRERQEVKDDVGMKNDDSKWSVAMDCRMRNARRKSTQQQHASGVNNERRATRTKQVRRTRKWTRTMKDSIVVISSMKSKEEVLPSAQSLACVWMLVWNQEYKTSMDGTQAWANDDSKRNALCNPWGDEILCDMRFSKIQTKHWQPFSCTGNAPRSGCDSDTGLRSSEPLAPLNSPHPCQ